MGCGAGKQEEHYPRKLILDRTLTPALDAFGLEAVRMIDASCLSGHFLFAAFTRLFRAWQDKGARRRSAHLTSMRPMLISGSTRYKLLGEDPKTYVLIFDTGDELAAGLSGLVLGDLIRSDEIAFGSASFSARRSAQFVAASLTC